MKLIIALLLALPLCAQNTPERERLNGTWQSDQGTWTIAPKGDAVHISQDKGLEIDCNTMGKECKTKVNGRQTKVTMWFSGPKLVVLETRGSEVTKRRFEAKDDQTLAVEVIPIVPAGKPETLTFKKMDATTAQK